MTEIQDVLLAVEKGNRISALTMLRQLDGYGKDPYLINTEIHILANELTFAEMCLEIAEIKAKHPKIKDVDTTRLDELTDNVNAMVDKFNKGEADEEMLDDAVISMYRQLQNVIKEERGL